MILTYVQDHGVGEIDMATYETIAKIIETRRLDVSCNVRAHAVLLAKFFQDPSSVNDPVIAGKVKIIFLFYSCNINEIYAVTSL